MDDETILARGGTQEDINEYAREHGADLTEDDVKHSNLVQAIKNNEPIYLSENGYALSEEDYLNFEEWVDNVGKPEGSTSEKFTRYISGRYEDLTS